MQAELISVGTELLLGQTLNTNAQFLAKELANLGINVYFQTTVGDNPERLLQALEIATHRADLIILTGGLGPTQDDLTKETLAAFLKLPLEIVPAELERLKAAFCQATLPWTNNNSKQAAFIPGSIILPNSIGSAAGMAFKKGNKGYLLLPGPPSEMKQMFLKSAQPWLNKYFRNENQGHLYSTKLKFIGITESGLEVLLTDLLEEQSEVTLALYAQPGEIQLRLTSRAADKKEFEEKIRPLLQEIKKRTTAYFFARDEVTINEVVAKLLKVNNLTISTAESCTGGLLAASLTSVSGASAYFLGSLVAYDNQVKVKLLGIPQKDLEINGAVSACVGKKMAQKIKQLTNSDLGIGITGVAGPEGGTIKKPVGLVYIGMATPENVFCNQYYFRGNREMIRRRTVRQAYYLIWKYLQKMLK
jgi:nicotinamide-nucleotide amidase